MGRAVCVSEERPPSADRLPTLTEVLELGRDSAPDAAVAISTAPIPDEARIVQLVLAELEPRVQRLLEDRLREALAPALARVADGLVREVRTELAIAVRELVAEAVAQAAGDSFRGL